MQFFQDTFETNKRLFIMAFSICMTLPLSKLAGEISEMFFPMNIRLSTLNN